MESKTKTCPYCQKQLPMETNFCWYCTRQLDARPERPDVQHKSSPWTVRILIVGMALVVLVVVYLVLIIPLVR